MCKKFFSRFKFRLLLIGALVLLWWWVKTIQKQSESRPAFQANSIILPETAESIVDTLQDEMANRRSAQISVPEETPSGESKTPKDDLRRIEGIGPKIASVLVKAGLDSFEKLSNTKPEEIKAILEMANIPLAQPDTWPEQARLAAANNWQALAEFQGQLKGGRRV